jgi:restriction endonuclease S subunit
MSCTTDYIDSSEVMISEDFAYQNNLTIVEANTILLSVRGTIGKVILSGCKIAISPTLVAIEVDKNKAKPYFVYQWFLNKKEYFEANAVGATIASLSTAFIKELKIDLPPIETQNKFEKYKNDLDNIKQTLSKLSDENQNLSKSIFNQFY